MTTNRTIIFFLFLTISCKTDNDKFIIKTDDKYEIVDSKKQIVSQTIQTLRLSDSLPIANLTKIYNYNNDTRIHYLTGLTKEDGLQDYLLDSIYYDNNGNDTLKKSFVFIDKHWQPAQAFYKKFRADKQVVYFMTERPYHKDRYFKKEIFYSYNTDGQLISETEFECSERTVCDSIFKKKYVYNLTGDIDTTAYYVWKNNEWTEYKKNGR